MSAVPNLSNLTNLTDIFISGQKDLEDISGLLTAPNLKKLTLTNVPQLDPELLRPALDHLVKGRVHPPAQLLNPLRQRLQKTSPLRPP